MRSDPRYREALRLFDMTDWGWGMPSDPHARENLRAAAGYLAAASGGIPDAEEFLSLVVRQYLGEKYQDAIRKDIERIAKAARITETERRGAHGAQGAGNVG